MNKLSFKSQSNLIIVFALFVYISLSFSFTLAFDDNFSIEMAKLPINEMFQITAKDVHPPLYYLILKPFVLLFPNSLFAVRFVSIIPLLVLIKWGGEMMKNLLNEKLSIYFQLLVLCTPFIMSHSINIRMYSWAILFVTLATIQAILFYQNKVNIVLLTIFSIASAYLHTYALLYIAFLYFNLLIIILLNNRKNLKELFYSIIMCFLFYSPWFLVLVNQVKTVSDYYWISFAIDLHTLQFYLLFYIIILIGFFIIDKLFLKSNSIFVLTVVPFFEIIIFSLIFSIVIQPVFLNRYISIGIGMLLIYIIYIVDKFKFKKIFLLACIISFIVGYANAFKNQYKKDVETMYKISIDTISENDVIISDVSHFANKYSPIRFYKNYKNEYYLLGDKIYSTILEDGIIKYSEIKFKFPDNGKVIGLINDEKSIENLKKLNYELDIIKSLNFDGSLFYIYNIKQ